MKVFLAVLTLCLAGCAGDQSARMAKDIKQEGPSLVKAEVVEDVPTPRLVEQSNNATQQSLTGLGVQISKLAESVSLFKGDLAHIEAKVDTRLSAAATLDLELKTQMRADLQASIAANTKIAADLQVRVDALGAAVVGFQNTIQQTTQSVAAGHDSIIQTNNFSKEMKDTLISLHDKTVQMIWIMAGIATAIVSSFCALITGMVGAFCGLIYKMLVNDRKELQAVLHRGIK